MQIIKPNFRQESVWDFPRPPKVESTHKQIYFTESLIADTKRAWRVLEMGYPPVYYLPPEDILWERSYPTARRFLWGLDYQRYCWAVQGGSSNIGLVS